MQTAKSPAALTISPRLVKFLQTALASESRMIFAILQETVASGKVEARITNRDFQSITSMRPNSVVAAIVSLSRAGILERTYDYANRSFFYRISEAYL